MGCVTFRLHYILRIAVVNVIDFFKEVKERYGSSNFLFLQCFNTLEVGLSFYEKFKYNKSGYRNVARYLH
jgi:hypothetical protein